MMRMKQAVKDKSEQQGKEPSPVRGRQKALTGMLKNIGAMAGAGVLTAAVCILLLFVTGLIPQSAIKESCEESAEYFMEHDLFDHMIAGQFNTNRDNYADCILLNVMYHVSDEDTFRSLIRASYYNPELEEVNVSFYDSLREDQEPNVDYFRYWHGSMVLLRPLFVLTGIEGARLILGGVVLLQIAAAVMILWKLRARAAAVVYLIGNLLVQVWMCLFCVEYVTTFLVANGILLVELYLFSKRKSEEQLRKRVVKLMSVSGVLACFVDFLTTETLTITIPLLFLMILLYESGALRSVKEEIRYLAGCGVAWGLSYAGMFLLKWMLSVAVLGVQAFGEAMAAAGERISGTVYLGNTNLDPEAGAFERIIGLLYRNQGCLFPFKEEMSMGAAMWLFIGVCFVCFSVVYLLRPAKCSLSIVGLCLLLGAVPYLRYLVLQNHSYIHYFFTYRAQLVTVTAIGYCTWQFGLKGLFARKSH